MSKFISKMLLLTLLSMRVFAAQDLGAVYSRIEELTKKVVDPKDRALLTARLVYRIMDSEMWDRARDLAYTIEEPITQSKMLQYIAITYAMTFQKDKAIEVAQKMPLANYGIPVYLKIAKLFHMMGLEEDVDSLLLKAETESKALGIPAWESGYLAQTAFAYAYCGKLEHALEIATQLSVPSDRVEALASLSAFFENHDRGVEASEIMQIAMEIAKKEWELGKQADLLLKIAEGYENVSKKPEDSQETHKNFKRKIYSELYETDSSD